MLPQSVHEKNEQNLNKPSFWKSLPAGEFWKSKSMRMIPEEFVRSLPGAFEHRIVFSVRWGNSWQFWLEREKDVLFMAEEDWNEFVNDNHLAPDDMLCFTHDNSWFLDARIFKNGREVMDDPTEEADEPATEPESDVLNPQPLNSYKETTTASASSSGVTNGQAKTDYAVKNPEQYLSNPKNPFFVRTLVTKNDVLYVKKGFVDRHWLEFGSLHSPITYFTPNGIEEAAYKIYNGCHVINGWARVVRRNNLKKGDSVVCEFELSGNLVTAVRVHFMK